MNRSRRPHNPPIYKSVQKDLGINPDSIKPRTHSLFMRQHRQADWLRETLRKYTT